MDNIKNGKESAVMYYSKDDMITNVTRVTLFCIFIFVCLSIVNQTQAQAKHAILQNQIQIVRKGLQILSKQNSKLKEQTILLRKILEDQLSKKNQNKELLRIEKQLKQSKEYQRNLNTKLGYITQQIGELRMQLSQFHQGSHRTPPKTKTPQGKPNRRHY